MADWARVGNVRGPQGPAGPEGPAGTPDYSVVFPVGSVYYNTSGRNPSAQFGGTWVRRDSLGAFAWERTA